MSEEREVTIVIKGKNLTSAEFAAARRDLAGLDDGVRKTATGTNMLGSAVKLAGAAFAGMSIVNVAKDVLDYAGNIKDLSAQTGLSTRAIQEMSHAAKMTGTSIDAFTNAAFKLGTNLAGGGTSVEAAVNKLGLSYAALRQMSPDKQFEQIAGALGQVQNAQERNKLAVELFGKAAKDILPAIAAGYDQLKDSATIAGDAQLDALDMAGDALDGFKESVMSLGVQVAGGLVIALREAGREFEDLTGIVRNTKRGLDEWSTIFEGLGLKGAELPKVLNASATAAKNLPAPLGAVTLSTIELERAEKKLTEQVNAKIEANKKAIAAQKELEQAQQRFAASVQRLDTAEFFVPFVKSVREASFELEELAATVPVIAQAFVPFKAAVQESSLAVDGWGAHMRTTLEGLPTVIMSAIQGGGSIIGAAGSHIGTSLMTRFQERFGPAISAALPFGIGAAVNALLPTLGALFGPVAEKIGSFFRNIFGGPSAEELRGRQAVADFEAQLHSLLTQTQRNEAGNESWKMTVIAIRDAYIKAGHSEAEALAAADRLWKSSKQGAGATQQAIDEINAVMNGTTVATTEAGDATEDAMAKVNAQIADTEVRVLGVSSALANIPRNIDIDITAEYHGPEIPNYDGGDSLTGFARGTFGVTGMDFPDFGPSGTPVIAHNREAIVPYEDRIETAMRWLGGIGMPSAQPAGGGPPINLYLAVDPSSGRARQLGEAERAQIQEWHFTGELQVPQRNVSQRGR